MTDKGIQSFPNSGEVKLMEVIVARNRSVGKGKYNRQITEVFTRDGHLIAREDTGFGCFKFSDLVDQAIAIISDVKPKDDIHKAHLDHIVDGLNAMIYYE